jgi:hypothetical protein
MGWLFKSGCSRRDLIAERTQDWERTNAEDIVVKTTCLAHCYRGGVFSGVLWTVWGRSFTRDGAEVQPSERWIGCDLLRCQIGFGWGHKDLDESMHPYFYSCPLKSLDLMPIERCGGKVNGVRWCAAITKCRPREGEIASQRKGHRIDSTWLSNGTPKVRNKRCGISTRLSE